MLSIIICSIHDHLLSAIKKSIANTIGVEYELLVWNNKDEQLGLCEVYNKMAAQAKYPYLCFCHEDILFETQDWGRILRDIFERQPDTSLIGIAGSTYKSNFFSGWFTGIETIDFFRIKHEINGKEIELVSSQSFPDQRVVCIDGVFMVCKKSVWQTIKFNEQLLKGFHFYDIDFSLRVALVSDVIVTDKILLRHITQGGDYGNKWIEAAFTFHEAMKGELPFSVENNFQAINLRIAKTWMDRLKSEKISLRYKMKWVYLQGLHKRVSLSYAIAKFFLYEPLGLRKIHQLLKRTN